MEFDNKWVVHYTSNADRYMWGKPRQQIAYVSEIPKDMVSDYAQFFLDAHHVDSVSAYAIPNFTEVSVESITKKRKDREDHLQAKEAEQKEKARDADRYHKRAKIEPLVITNGPHARNVLNGYSAAKLKGYALTMPNRAIPMGGSKDELIRYIVRREAKLLGTELSKTYSGEDYPSNPKTA